MSEHLKTNHENHETHKHPEQHRSHEAHQTTPEVAELSAAEQAKKIEAIHKTISHEAKASEEIHVGHHEKETTNREPSLAERAQLRKNNYTRTLARTRKKLSAPSRLFSDVVHQPVVDAISTGAEKTVARPLPILSAGLFAFVGSSIFLYMAKHYGFRYNLGVFFALLLIGFAVGLLVDLVKIALAKRRPSV